MAGRAWWLPGNGGKPVDLGQIGDMCNNPPVDATPTTSDMRTDLQDAMQRLAQPPAPADLTITFTADTSKFDAAMREVLLALAVRFTAVCPGCRRETHWLDYDLEAESCRACLEVIPRLWRTMRVGRVNWAPISPELNWRTDR